MTLPGLLLGLVVSTLYGVAFHLWRGGGLRRLLLFIILAWSGFWLGQIAGAAFNLTFFQVGTLLLGMATLGSIVLLFAGNWLFNSVR